MEYNNGKYCGNCKNSNCRIFIADAPYLYSEKVKDDKYGVTDYVLCQINNKAVKPKDWCLSFSKK